tara:strand:- start:1084 stop:2226 length:1143 start_codon:yes stop_codon:yes gene_type:complete
LILKNYKYKVKYNKNSEIDQSFFENKKILVTGGCGFIGSNLIRALLKKTNSYIFNIDKLSYASDSSGINEIIKNKNFNPKSRYKLIKLDLANYELTKETVNAIKPDLIFNLAAESHVDRSIDNPSIFISSNIIGTYNLLEATRKYYNEIKISKKKNFRFHHISTDEVYGSLGQGGYFSENSPYMPRSPYSASKASSDHLVNSWFHTFGIPTLITNCSNNYGPWQFVEKFIPNVILKALSGNKIPIYGSGLNIRDWLFVEDHIDALLLVASKGLIGSNYCIGGSNEKTNLAVCKDICRMLSQISQNNLNYENQIQFVTDRPGHDERYAINSSKITRELDWEPRFSYEEGLNITVKWYMENLKWCNYIQEKSGYEGERIGTE